jgi:hypothetical protein
MIAAAYCGAMAIDMSGTAIEADPTAAEALEKPASRTPSTASR